jgi:hypothetical protein
MCKSSCVRVPLCKPTQVSSCAEISKYLSLEEMINAFMTSILVLIRHAHVKVHLVPENVISVRILGALVTAML